MNLIKPIVIVAGEPNSIFFEIFLKSLKKLKTKSPIILVGSKNFIKYQMKNYNFKKKIKLLDKNKINYMTLNNKYLNVINVSYNPGKQQKKRHLESNKYLFNCFETAVAIIKKYHFKKFINGPINKKKFLNKKFLGI